MIVTLALLVAAPSMALTFDDGTSDATVNRQILAALADAAVKSVLFVAGANVDSPRGLAQVRAWGEAGHWVGNHTYRHSDLHSPAVPPAAFEADVMRAHALLAEMPGYVRIFRFPYLHEGKTEAQRDRVRAFLQAAGYRQGGVTIDASDWYYAARYERWRRRHPGADPGPFHRAYLDQVWERARYYDALAARVAGRSVKHTLVLHTNRLNAETLPALIQMFRQRGWTIVAPAEAFADPIFAAQPRGVPAGEGVVWSLARAAGVEGLRYPAESDAYEKAKMDAAGL